MIFLILTLVFLLSWLGVGWWLVKRGSRPVTAGGLFRRVDKSVVAVGEEVEVELMLTPPSKLGDVEPRDLMLVIDRSGSMGSGPASHMGRAVQAAQKFLDRCPDAIRVGLVAFHHSAERLHPLGAAGSVRRALQEIRASGSTSIAAGLEECQRELQENGRKGIRSVVLLLSDGFASAETSIASADALRSAVPNVEICAAALGASVDRELLHGIAGHEDNVFPVNTAADFDHLFTFLAQRLSSSVALSTTAREASRTPSPFRLVEVAPAAAQVSQDESGNARTQLAWHFPVLDDDAIRLTYSLRAECPGWHSVAQSLDVVWTMPDGTPQEAVLGEGPRVLAVPSLLAWLWPALNPLLFLLLENRLCAGVGDGEKEDSSQPLPLRHPQLPEALPTIDAKPFRPDVHPTLFIGLGEVGEDALCRLRRRLDDRVVRMDDLRFRSIHLAGLRKELLGDTSRLTDEERLELSFDFYPYLERLRKGEVPPERRWVPWRSWLASARPQSHDYEPDRRRARLAALELADQFEATFHAPLQEIAAIEGSVVIVGSLDDPVASGLVGEVAHLCASMNLRSTIVLARDRQERLGDRAALSRELSRFVLLRGDEVASDRTSPPSLACRLVDRLVVLATNGLQDAAECSSELAYGLLLWRELEGRLPLAQGDINRALVPMVRLESVAWPSERLWRWVRDRTLVRDVVCHCLGWLLDDGRPKEPEEKTVEAWVERFWTAQGTRRSANALVAEGGNLLRGGAPESLLVGRLPFDEPLHEQVAFHERERRTFAAYLEDWSCRLLVEESESERCGWSLLQAVLRRLEADHTGLVEAVEGLSNHPALAQQARFARDLLADQRLVIEGLYQVVVRECVRWIGRRDSVATRLIDSLRRDERSLTKDLDLISLAERAEAWADRHGPISRRRLAFTVRLGCEAGSVHLDTWVGNKKLLPEADPVEALREELGRYRFTVDADWLPPVEARRKSFPHHAFRIGGRSQEVFPGVENSLVEEDPAYAACLSVELVPIEEALGVVAARSSDLPFVWPEEANAARLANWLRQKPIEREPMEWPPRVVNLLRDPEAFLGFLRWLAMGRIKAQGEYWVLTEDGTGYRIGEIFRDPSPTKALENLEDMARRVVSLGRSLDGEPVVSSFEAWSPDSVSLLEAIQMHPAVEQASEAPGWQVWRDLIQALALEKSVIAK